MDALDLKPARTPTRNDWEEKYKEWYHLGEYLNQMARNGTRMPRKLVEKHRDTALWLVEVAARPRYLR